MTTVRIIGILCARELSAFFLSAVGAVVGAAFVLLQGLSFWGLVTVLANPARPAPYGAVLQNFFGGTLLYWAVVFAVISTLTMRTYAEEKQRGTWELLTTAGASDVAIVAGKALAGVLTYAALWVPTLGFIAVINGFSPADSGLEWGPVVSAYLGVFVVGCGLVGLGQVASSLLDRQLGAALATFSVSMAVLLVMELVAPSVSVRAHVADLARGLIRWSVVMGYLGVAIVFFAIVYASVSRRRRQRREQWRRWILALAIASVVSGIGRISHLLMLESDLTGSRIHSLERETLSVLDQVDVPVHITVITPTLIGFTDVFAHVEAVLARMSHRQPLLAIVSLDPAKSAQAVASVAESLSLPASQIAEGGAIIFSRGKRSRVLEVTSVADFSRDPLGAGQMAAFWAEGAFAGAIADVIDTRVRTACTLSNPGTVSFFPQTSAPSASSPSTSEADAALDWGLVAKIVRRDGIHLRQLSADRIDDQALDGCNAALVVGVNSPLPPAFAQAISDFVSAGGGLLVAVRSQSFRSLGGIELILAEAGISLRRAVVLDPEETIGIPLVWATSEGYGDHPISKPFAVRGARTVWPAPWALGVDTAKATAIVVGSAGSWAETDLDSVFAGVATSADPSESQGNVPVVAATIRGSRVVVFGSLEAAGSQFVGRGLGAGHLLAAHSIEWLVGRDSPVSLVDKMPEHLRLLLSPRAKKIIFIVVVIVMPLIWLILFGWLAWRRRDGVVGMSSWDE